jgi:hypothetical protein
VESLLWKRFWSCRETDYQMNERDVTVLNKITSIRIPFRNALLEELSKLVRSPCDLAGVPSLYDALHVNVLG